MADRLPFELSLDRLLVTHEEDWANLEKMEAWLRETAPVGAAMDLLQTPFLTAAEFDVFLRTLQRAMVRHVVAHEALSATPRSTPDVPP